MFLAVTTDTNNHFAYITDPNQIDDHLINQWATIHDGQHHQAAALKANYHDAYDHHTYHALPYHVTKITAQDLLDTFAESDPKAVGMDGWSLQELRLITLPVAQHLADLLNTIEEGADWPHQLLHAKIHQQLKDPAKPRTALNHRGLTILVYLYREWAKLRLKCLRPWIAMWDTPELFAGVPGKGAEDAWYTTAIDIEHNQLQDIPMSGAAADMFKCFDQILLELVTHILTAAGMPPTIISAYTRYITHLMYYNSLGTTIGKPHHHKCGIPQGCPFSMLIIALLLRPWILMMRQIPATPRLLADDILVLTQGQHHEVLLHTALDATHLYIASIGGKIASTKRYDFSTNRKKR